MKSQGGDSEAPARNLVRCGGQRPGGNGEGREQATNCCVKYNLSFSEYCKVPDTGSDIKPLSHAE